MIYILGSSWLLTQSSSFSIISTFVWILFCLLSHSWYENFSAYFPALHFPFPFAVLVLGFKKYFLYPISDIPYFAHLFLLLTTLLSWILFVLVNTHFPFTFNLFILNFLILSSPFMSFLLTSVNSNFSCIFRQGWLLFFTKNTYGTVGVSPSSQECQELRREELLYLPVMGSLSFLINAYKLNHLSTSIQNT